MAAEYKKMSMLSLEAAQKFLANTPDATPGGLLEVAALIEGYLTGRFRVEYRSDFEPIKDGEDVFSLFSHVRAVVIDPAGEGASREGMNHADTEGRITNLHERIARYVEEIEEWKRAHQIQMRNVTTAQRRAETAEEKLGEAKENIAGLIDARKLDALKAEEKRRKLEARVVGFMKAGKLAARTALICVPMLIICVIALVWVLFSR